MWTFLFSSFDIIVVKFGEIIMLVLIDINNAIILLYEDNGVKKIPFSEVNTLSEYTKNKKIYYVTNAIEVNTEEIVKLIYSLVGTNPSSDFPSFVELENKQLYLHSISKGTVYISETLKFDNKFDCKIYNEEMQKIVENSLLLKKLIKDGKFEIIGEQSRRILMAELKSEKNKNKEIQKKVDESLDKILLDRPVGQVLEEGIGNDRDDAILIELGGGGENDSSEEINENLKLINKLSENRIK